MRRSIDNQGSLPSASNGVLDVKTLETWLWDAACQIRGPLDAPKFKDYILPLIFLKRLSDVFDDEVQRVADEVDDLETAKEIIDGDHGLVRFYLPPESRWPAVALKTTGLGEALTDAVRAVARHSPRLQGVIDTVDFNATTAGQPIVDNDRLAALVKTLGQHRLGLKDVQPDLLGRPTSTCYGSSPKGRARAQVSSTHQPKLHESWLESLTPAGDDGLRSLLRFVRTADKVPPPPAGNARKSGKRAPGASSRNCPVEAVRSRDQSFDVCIVENERLPSRHGR